MSAAAGHVGNLEAAIVWTLDAKYAGPANLERSLLLTLASQALIDARSLIVRALRTEVVPEARCTCCWPAAKGGV